MKTIFNVLTIVSLVLGLVFTILPLEKIALIPVILALLFAGTSFFLSNYKSMLSKVLLAIGAALLLTVIIKIAVGENKVEGPSDEEKLKREQVDMESQKDLEDLPDEEQNEE